jgi:hypothetical protein
MAPLPTASRIFADQYMRDIKRREKKFSDQISPGTNNWTAAMFAFFDKVGNTGSPIKRSQMIRQLTQDLNNTAEHGAHFLLDYGGSNRSAGVMFATLSAGEHPLLGVDEEGVLITKHMIVTRRNGSLSVLPDVCIAYVCKHAIGRLHERGCDFDNSKASCVMACVGILGLLTRDCNKHVDGGLSIRYEDTLIVGSLKHAVKTVGYTPKEINGTLFDVRSALPIDETTNYELLSQGHYATHAVAKWLDYRTISREANSKLAEDIPYLPARDDYTTSRAVPYPRNDPDDKQLR